MFFCLETSVGQKKILSPHEESNLRPLDSFGFHAPMLWATKTPQ